MVMLKTNESAPAAMQKGYRSFVDSGQKEERTITEEEERDILNGDEEQTPNSKSSQQQPEPLKKQSSKSNAQSGSKEKQKNSARAGQQSQTHNQTKIHQMLQKVRNQSDSGKNQNGSRQNVGLQKSNYVQKAAFQHSTVQNLKETQTETKSQLIMVPITQSSSTPNHAMSNQNGNQKQLGQNSSSVKKITKFAF